MLASFEYAPRTDPSEVELTLQERERERRMSYEATMG